MRNELPRIPFIRLSCILQAETECALPVVKGSMLRGAFGQALRRTVCVNPHGKECSECMLRESCVFTQVFETFVKLPAPPTMKGVLNAPKPFILHSFSEKTTFATGDSLAFDMTLLGDVCKLYPYIIYSIIHMSQRGLGARREPFTLIAVTAQNGRDGVVPVYRHDSETLLNSIEPQPLQAATALQQAAQMQFITPTRLKSNGQYTMDFTFRWLVVRMLQRVMELAYFYVDADSVYWDFGDWMQAANAVDLKSPQFRWHNWPRYSNRQHRKMDMGGFIGAVSLHGELAPFSELLSLCEILHIGKGTSFGLGKIKVQTA